VFLWFENLIKKGYNNGYEFDFSEHWCVPWNYPFAGYSLAGGKDIPYAQRQGEADDQR
jgi:hypothetical protein